MLLKEMSQAQLSRKTDIPVKSISRILAAEPNKIIDGFEMIARALDEEPRILMLKDGYKCARSDESKQNLTEERTYANRYHMSEIDKKKMVILQEILMCDDKNRLTDLKQIIQSALRKVN